MRLPVLVESVKAHGFEGLVAKRRNSPYGRLLPLRG
jgi:ATP-dependent DNA ligase